MFRQEDIVPKIPPQEWGFERYGVDLPIVSSDTDLDSTEIMKHTAELNQEITGAPMIINPDLNYHLRCIIDYVLYLMPDSAAYTRMLQPVLVDRNNPASCKTLFHNSLDSSGNLCWI